MKAWFCAVLLVVVFTLPRLHAQILAGPITNAANGHAYFLLAPTNWTAMESQAQSLGGHLATVRDAFENEWLLSTFNPFTGSNLLFIGYTDEALEGQFLWASGETNSFTNWRTGEPNNRGGQENFTIIRVVDGKWNDVVGTSQYGVAEVFNTQTNQVQMLSIRNQPSGVVELSWPSTGNQLYRVSWTTNVAANAWTVLGPYRYGNGITNYLSDYTTNASQKFYRVDAIY